MFKFVYIDVDTLVRAMKKSFNQTVNRILIIDARYGYEFKGGHIKGAVNIPSEVNFGRISSKNQILRGLKAGIKQKKKLCSTLRKLRSLTSRNEE